MEKTFACSSANILPPKWDLGDLYPGMHHPDIARDWNKLLQQAQLFQRTYEGRVTQLSAGDLLKAIEEYQQNEELAGKLMSYAYLLQATHVGDAEIGGFLQNIQEKTTQAGGHTLFFTLEINKIPVPQLQELLKDQALQKFQGWLRIIRAFQAHQLSDELEKFNLEKSTSGRSSWIRLYDETLAKLRFNLGHQQVTISQALHVLEEPDALKREQAAKEIARVLKENVALFSLVTNTLAKEKETEDRWRKFTYPAAARHLANQVEGEVVETLVHTVRQAYPGLSHRYYRLKAKYMGQTRLHYWDRNAPYLSGGQRKFTWKEACDIVLKSYQKFSPTFAKIAKQFIDQGWIDAVMSTGKDSGAFAHPTVPSVHPYILLNFQGSMRDVMTLAHELGHGVHQTLSAKQGALMADAPLPLAETASVFGEMLTFQNLLGLATDPQEKVMLLTRKIEDMLNTVVRQIAFHQFETLVHQERRQQELSPQRLGEIWMQVQKESLGDAFDFGDEYQYYWAYIPHFIHSPFYVYAYAFADCLVNSLYGIYQKKDPSFMDNYMKLLTAGGSAPYQQLLAPFGMDIQKRDFWQQGISLLESMINQLEQHLKAHHHG